MKKVLRLLIPLLILAAAVGFWRAQSHNGESDGVNLNLYGNVDMREVGLAINGVGRIADMLAREGELVSKGQLLARLDSDRLQALVARAAAQVEMQQAVVARLEAGNRPEDIRRAGADLAAARAQAKDAARTAARLQSLSSRDLASRELADNAATAAAAAHERVKAGSEILQLAELGPRSEDIDAARAQLKEAQAQLALANKELAEAALYAPSDGMIRNRILEPGDMASPQRPLYTLAITNPLWVRAYVSETDLGRVRPGMTAEVSTDSFPGKEYRGWIGYISPSAEFTPQSVQTEEMRTQLVYQVRIYVCNPQGELRLGMPASVHISLKQAQTAPGGNDPCHGQE
ncbi:MAG: hemolysin D [Zetaproteobacteria bacterium CG12_big_fil_rev_8_21_14_0_65_55_1124]|nr:MAG: hemolysin D [Zetaproteobacteria bacterium CG1_02_55_237]PIS19264.1 MAG: hemolysin D [Zetaproteobacteria bacterium CG08_land_8_20_14_0_20_55_17]PIW43558.1 MAG: hemolysin D [Zetaproteobacteria bacterium CG12_big_fil_rev_8_21_14_0_65_55_1124]PIY54387.1 MAG: hemolysin D [Zetaproteobacteria bacterium CG_4_10_14_0_8_um_filter_55_43]PIZ39022.1 MAG: hemolysin D [Zetaproteobacteria bacterium CG_4_10_14_0_2_um_filter_55_20]PJB80327.1 MAG: hemolysin D [Zetaproteobacteria bacterium CG_4_9_14_0_8_u